MKSTFINSLGIASLLVFVLGASCQGNTERKAIIGIAQTVDNLASRWAEYYVTEEAQGRADANLQAKDERFWQAHSKYQIAMAKVEQAWMSYESVKGTVQEMAARDDFNRKMGDLRVISDALGSLLIELIR